MIGLLVATAIFTCPAHSVCEFSGPNGGGAELTLDAHVQDGMWLTMGEKGSITDNSSQAVRIWDKKAAIYSCVYPWTYRLPLGNNYGYLYIKKYDKDADDASCSGIPNHR